MKFNIKGSKKYLISAILFGIAGFLFLSVSIFNYFEEGNSPLFGFSSGLVIFAFIMLWFWKLYKETGQDPLKKNIIFFIGYLFSWLGIGFTQALLIGEVGVFKDFVAPVVVGIIGVPLLIVGIKNIIEPGSVAEDRNKKVIRWVLIFATIAGIMPVILIIAAAYYNGNYIIASLILAVLSFFIWLFLFLFKKKKNRTL